MPTTLTPDGFDWSDPDDWLAWFVGVPLRVLIIVLVGTITLAVLRRLIRQVTEHIAEGSSVLTSSRLKGIGKTEVGAALLKANPLANARRGQRARTIGSVLRSTANILVGATVALLVLTEVGVNIGPFLASAGIAGVALGFGAQSLVKDFLSGTFMLLEDQYGVGDTVDLGEVVGTVEEVALRVTKVRSIDGTLWYIRNGEILRTGNMTQEWARASVDVRVAYHADVDQVREVLRQAIDELEADQVLSTYLLETPEIFGIETMSAEALLLTVRVKTRAGMQWEVSRALRAGVRTHLAAAGIPLAGAQQIVVLDHSPAASPEDPPAHAPEVAPAASPTEKRPQAQENKGSPA
ncbi:mechanosensitive ion channel family protein [Oerskovia flava]|uniref:mechanosensitive ion channel family protein n=1 Tax=Oerskovia flava TaxID=2986422 RepID=UPI00223FCF25|nr:mechanosensitive ion channel family protein [Oerskovia sp. JB1-3-2]